MRARARARRAVVESAAAERVVDKSFVVYARVCLVVERRAVVLLRVCFLF